MPDAPKELAGQIEDRAVAIIKAANTASEDRVYSDAEFRIDKAKTPYVRVSCPTQRLVSNRRHGRSIIEITDYNLVVVVFGAATADTGDIKTYVRNEGAKIRAAIANDRTLKDEAGTGLAFWTHWQDMAAAVDGTGDKARAACRNTFTVRAANLDTDPTQSLPQRAAEEGN